MHEIFVESNRPAKGFWRELWQYRELFFFLAWRNILVQYKQTVIGVAWSILRPLLAMIVFTIVFGRIAGLPSGGVPYPLLVYSAMIPWLFFSNTLSESSNSLVTNEKMISKVYFPRIIIPSSAIAVSLIDLLVSSGILVVLLCWYRFIPGWRVVMLPLMIGIAGLASLGLGYWVSVMNAKYRDFRYVIPFAVQLGLYVSPVGFSSDVIPGQWRLLYSLNPMVGVIDGFRWALLGGDMEIYWPGFLLSTGLAAALFVCGGWFFMKLERQVADFI